MSIIRTLSLSCALAFALSLPSLPVMAQGTQIAFGGLKHDSALPVEITSDQLSVDQNTGKAIFTGNVVIGQGTMRLAAKTVEVIYGSDTSQIARLLASGGVTITNAGEAAEAQNAEYNLESGTVTLTGNVLLTQGNSVMSGERMVIDLNTGTGRMDGRVKTILQSGKDQ
ncbi:lipopolysaccharide transport periplasmic protein LptA [Celeribacter persicus]|uniref:Lipopolysaccharide export system protein LptA n=1 Tax=Celeribacter persicus TaxID=1651082 RepID=A0A2T5HDX0_9RHOB|nr:lipopolysaccharide transport periplasmic protein LptA [Celeribacter persicus]PTQ69756.1 lipopolysaccharide export system protein LptA [Celeribacter persicus]